MDEFLSDVSKDLEQNALSKENESNNFITYQTSLLWKNRKISEEERQKFSDVFSRIGPKQEGTIDVETAMKIFERSKLDAATLGRIFTLSDYDLDYRLDCEQFILAMFLIQCKLSGEQLPNAIPESMIPRKARKAAVYEAIPAPDVDIEKIGLGILKLDLTMMKMGKRVGRGPSLKLCVIGEQCGKSALIMRFLFDEFSDNESPTVEELYEVNYQFNGREYHLRIQDTSGNEFYMDHMFEKWIKDADGILLVFSIDSAASFSSLENYRVRVMKIFKDDRIPLLVVGTKADRKDFRQVSTEELMVWSLRYSFSYEECSSKNGDNVEHVFQLLLDKIQANIDKGITVQYNSGVSKKKGKGKTSFLKGLSNSKKGTINEAISAMCKQEEDLLKVLRNPEECNEFKEFLEKKGYGAIHLIFWTTIEEFKKLSNSQDWKTRGLTIFHSFFYKDMPLYNLKIPDKIAKELKKNVQNEIFSADMFDNIQQAVFHQIQTLFFPEFVKRSIVIELQESGKDIPMITLDETDTTIKEERNDNEQVDIQMISDTFSQPSLESPLIEPTEADSESSSSFVDLNAELSSMLNDETLTETVSEPSSHNTHYRGILKDSKKWYYGSIIRQEAEALLAKCPENVFLVRTSSIPGYYALSCFNASTKAIIHYAVVPVLGGYCIQGLDDKVYQTLSDLIAKSQVVAGYKPVGNFK